MNESIDIILPNYNKKPYITECLDSLLAQTYSNWRCIVVDGFSEDGSWEVIQKIAKEDNRFELYQLPKEGNLYQAWNFGLLKVKNPYFCILTSDDIWNINWLGTAIQSLNRNKNAIGVAARTTVVNTGSQYQRIALLNSIGERFFETSSSTPQLRKGIINAIASYFLGNIYTSIHSLLLRSKILAHGESFAEDVGSTADYEWNIRIGLHGDIIYHPEIEVGWRLYEGQATKPRLQEENGKLIQKIHFRNRDEIARRLGVFADDFRENAKNYDERVLAYHYSRSSLVNLRYQPLTELVRLSKVLTTRPKELSQDFLYKLQRKNFYLEESIATAIKVCDKIA